MSGIVRSQSATLSSARLTSLLAGVCKFLRATGLFDEGILLAKECLESIQPDSADAVAALDALATLHLRRAEGTDLDDAARK